MKANMGLRMAHNDKEPRRRISQIEEVDRVIQLVWFGSQIQCTPFVHAVLRMDYCIFGRKKIKPN